MLLVFLGTCWSFKAIFFPDIDGDDDALGMNVFVVMPYFLYILAKEDEYWSMRQVDTVYILSYR